MLLSVSYHSLGYKLFPCPQAPKGQTPSPPGAFLVLSRNKQSNRQDQAPEGQPGVEGPPSSVTCSSHLASFPLLQSGVITAIDFSLSQTGQKRIQMVWESPWLAWASLYSALPETTYPSTPTLTHGGNSLSMYLEINV